ncbi:YcjF family protein [Thalassospira sp.]|uniref:YcjF family protein n=1 Tax=Thalassospira sp. TaxID=1912094 RepID=UPI003AA964B3
MSEAETIEETEEVTLAEADELRAQSRDCIHRHSVYAAVGGLVPIPFLEMATSSTIQLRMLAKLCDIYGVPFSENAIKNSVATLVATVFPVTGVGVATASLIRRIPVAGTVFGMVAMPTFAAASTYALGRVFSWHFARGGTACDFDSEEMKDRFKSEFAEGKRKASEFVKGGSSKTTSAKSTGSAATAKA